jgi:hypothetical protein
LGFSKILGIFQRFFRIFDEVYEDFQSNLPLDFMYPGSRGSLRGEHFLNLNKIHDQRWRRAEMYRKVSVNETLYHSSVGSSIFTPTWK